MRTCSAPGTSIASAIKMRAKMTALMTTTMTALSAALMMLSADAAPASQEPAKPGARAGAGTAAAGNEDAGQPVPVTVENFIRAETDMYFGGVVRDGGFGRFNHNREPTPIDQQPVIRMDRDTLYSAAVFDLATGPVTITLPVVDAKRPASPADAEAPSAASEVPAADAQTPRFMSMQVINQDHYTSMVVYGGTHTLTRSEIGTQYVLAAVRTLVDPNDPEDVKTAHALQDAIKVDQKVVGPVAPFAAPNWDAASRDTIRAALLTLAATMPDFTRAFGAKAAVDPVRHLLGTAMGWGGNPDAEARYISVAPTAPPGGEEVAAWRLTVRDVPVDGFWSVSVYNAMGYFEPNDLNAYSVNNITAKKAADGSVTIQFGECEGVAADTINCLPITPGWNYTVRLYRPRAEILEGKWTFPAAKPVK